jgi:DNA polymerase III epsilon subunit-like protein
MSGPITLAMSLYQEEKQVTMCFYCDIPDVKQGYMFISFGCIPYERALWKGLHMVLVRMANTYRDRDIKLAFSPLYFQLGSLNSKQETMNMLSFFKSLEHIPADEYEDALKKVNWMGIHDDKPMNILHGFTTEEFEERKQAVGKKKKYEVDPNYYEGAMMPPRGCVIDLEATSTFHTYARVIEYGIVKFENGQVVETLQSFVNPKMKIPKVVRQLTGITQRDVDRAPASFEAMKDLVQHLRGCEYLVGHNILYDFTFIDVFCQRFKLPRLDVHLVCTRKLAKKANIIVENYKLETLLALYNIVNERPHRALPDAKADFELMKSLYKESFLLC